jgi:hypothetical protein
VVVGGAGAWVVLWTAGFLVGLVADGLMVGVGDIVGVGDFVGVIGVVSAVTCGTCVLYENSAASPATVPPMARTARRI